MKKFHQITKKYFLKATNLWIPLLLVSYFIGSILSNLTKQLSSEKIEINTLIFTVFVFYILNKVIKNAFKTQKSFLKS